MVYSYGAKLFGPRPTQPEPALCAGSNEYMVKAGGVNRHIA